MARCRCMLACRVSRGVTGTSIRRASQRKLCQRGARNGAPGHVTSETGRVGLIDVCQTSQHRARLGSRGCLVLPASLPASRGQVEASRTRSSPTCSAITAGSSTAPRASCRWTSCASCGAHPLRRIVRGRSLAGICTRARCGARRKAAPLEARRSKREREAEARRARRLLGGDSQPDSVLASPSAQTGCESRQQKAPKHMVAVDEPLHAAIV